MSFLLLLFCVLGYSEEPTSAENEKSTLENVDDFTRRTVEKINAELTETAERRKERRKLLIGTYSPIDLWIPGKLGVTFGYNLSSSANIELEVLRGSVSVPFIIDDIGSISDSKVSALYRYYPMNGTFNFLASVNYNTFDITLGPSFLTVSGSEQFESVKVRTLGAGIGLGNRWQLESGLIIGIDWLSLFFPFHTLESRSGYLGSVATDQQKKDVNTVLSAIRNLPTASLFKMQLGWSF